MGESEKKLQVWYNESDHVIAESAEDAAKVWEETIGESWASYEDEGETWDTDNRDEWTILWIDAEPKPEDVPPGGKILETPDDYTRVVASQEAWIKHTGRGWLCSENW